MWDKQWPLAQDWNQQLPWREEAANRARTMWMGQFGWARDELSVFLSPPFSLPVCVRSILAMISLTILRMCLFWETKRVGQWRIVCAAECVCVLYRLHNVIVCDSWRSIVAGWDRDIVSKAKYGTCRTGQWGRNAYLCFLLLWKNCRVRARVFVALLSE